MSKIRTRMIAALLAAALIPLAASGVLVGWFMERTLAVGLNPEIREELEYSMELAKRLHRTLKSEWEMTVASLTAAELVRHYPEVEAVAVFDENGGCEFIEPGLPFDTANCPDELFDEVRNHPPLFPLARDDPDDINRLWIWRAQFPGFLEAIAVRIDGSHRARFEHTHGLLRSYRQIEEMEDEILRASVVVYLGLLAFIALLAFGVDRKSVV